jgi:hypothetical protein
MARAGSRRREFVLRTALGASRGRLLRQAVTESAVMSGKPGRLLYGARCDFAFTDWIRSVQNFLIASRPETVGAPGVRMRAVRSVNQIESVEVPFAEDLCVEEIVRSRHGELNFARTLPQTPKSEKR